MKFAKFVTVAAIFAASLATLQAEAGSIGRAGGGGFARSSSVSVSRPSVAPSKPSVAPAPSKPGGIGGTTASVGVRKTEVTNGVRQDVAATKPAPTAGSSFGSTSTSTPTPHYTPTPSYGYAPAPQPVVVHSGGGFGSTFMGAMTGTMVGNALFGNHGNSGGGTTVINNGTPGTVTSSTSSGVYPSTTVSSDGAVVTSSSIVQPKKEYDVWSFIADVIGFVFVIAILGLIAFGGYLAFKAIRSYVNKERGVSDLPLQPTQRFWEIQKAFSTADVDTLKTLLGPDIVDELTNGLEPQTLTLKNVSHEIRLQNSHELSVWYKFEDDGEEVNQVWHYERFGSAWKLNGIENV